MYYDDVITNFGINYFRNSLSTIWLKDKFCLVDNLDINPEEKGGFIDNVRSGAKFRLPVKLSMSFCLYCKEGKITARIQQKDYEITKGMFFIAFAGQILEGGEISDDCKILFLAIESKFVMQEIRHPRAKHFRHWVYNHQEPILFRVNEEQTEYYEMLCLSVKHIVNNLSSTTRETLLLGFVYMMGSLLLDWSKMLHNEGKALHLSHEEYVLAKFQEDIRNFSRKDRSVAFYAKRQFFSTKHFSRLIQKASRQKPLQLIRDHVILEAKSLLVTGKYSIKEVSDMLGFQNQSFFTRYFKDAVGCTPSNFATVG